MLSLTSTKWELLHGPYGNGGHIPSLITSLQQHYDQEQANELYYEELYHQNTIYPSTYVSVPYLVQMALEASNLQTQLDIYIVCGMFEAWNELPIGEDTHEPSKEWYDYFTDLDTEEVVDVYRSYQQSMQRLDSVLNKNRTQIYEVEESEKIHLLSATAALQGYRHWAKCFLMYSDGEEYIGACPNCDQDLYIWTDQNSELTEWRAYPTDPVMNIEANYQKIRPDAEYQNQEDLKWLYTYMTSLQMTYRVTQLAYLGGKVNCPHCSDDISIREALLKNIF